MAFYQNPHAPTCPWYESTQTYGAPNLKWCEESLCQWISEPANTWSNLGYFIIAIVIMIVAKRKNHGPLLRQFGPITLFVGSMSFIYHASNFYITQIFDFVGVFLYLGWPIGMNLIRMEKLKPQSLWKFNLLQMLVLIGLLHVMYLLGIKYQLIVLVMSFVLLGLIYKSREVSKIKYQDLFISLGIYSAAFIFSITDQERIWCDPYQHGWFSQGHALWHWCSAASLFFVYRFYSQESYLKKPEHT